MHISSSVQNQIISRLKNADRLRYSQIMPEGIANDLYNYHLKTLIAKNLIEKHADGYGLSDKGRRYVADVHHTRDQSQRLFKINVITIDSRVQDGQLQILNQERQAQPSYGKIGVMGGTILKGEALLDGAKRKLENETGLVANFVLLGHERRMRYQDAELLSDVLFPICYSDQSEGTLRNTEYGKNYWVSIDQAIENEKKDPRDSIVSIITVLEAIRDGTVNEMPLFYKETHQ